MSTRLFTSLIALLSTSLLIALFLTSFGVKLWAGFIIAVFSQIIIYNVYISLLSSYIVLKNKQLENERIKEFSYQGLEVSCPCSKKHKDFVPIRLNDVNMYRCGECDKSVSVYINAETALQTEPIISTDTSTALAPIIANITNGNS
jgi:hypothetical protein